MNGGYGLKKVTEENLEASHKDVRAYRISKARLFNPASNVTDIMARYRNCG